ncbi:general stress protein [Neobacillus terrae]|uniref:general stress protein n=1 Tax=Neobacillus terrae TaxID=3034837 RepID=UPI00140B9360|nr:general stress protein [Neobacillus terrae]NHM33987.1 hypothetical protein [Neobacillus terrae]
MPFKREYDSVGEALNNASRLYDNGVSKEEVFVLANKHKISDFEVPKEKLDVKDNLIKKDAEELHNKLEEIGFIKKETKDYKEELQDGKVLLVGKYKKDEKLLPDE